MRTNVKKLICGFLAAGAMFAIVGTANAEFCQIKGQLIRTPTYDFNTTTTTDGTVTYFSVNTTVNGTVHSYWGWTTEDTLANTMFAAFANGKSVEINSNNCGPVIVLSDGRLSHPMNKIRYVNQIAGLLVISPTANTGSLSLQKQ